MTITDCFVCSVKSKHRRLKYNDFHISRKGDGFALIWLAGIKCGWYIINSINIHSTYLYLLNSVLLSIKTTIKETRPPAHYHL